MLEWYKPSETCDNKNIYTILFVSLTTDPHFTSPTES